MKVLKKIMTGVLAVLMVVVASFTLVACEDIKTVTISLGVYNTDTAVVEDKTITLKLYRHLADETVDAILKYVGEGYYDDVLVYYESSESLVKFGDLKYEDGKITKKENKPAINGEFANNGVVGSNLESKEGSIGLWRTWSAVEDTYMGTLDSSRNSGRATVYMPTVSKTVYNGYFCVFGLFDTDDEGISKAWEGIKTVFSSANGDLHKQYTVYYTGEYDADKPDQDYGLTFHCVLTSDFKYDDDTAEEKTVDGEKVFEAKEYQKVEYNKKEIEVPVLNKSGVGKTELTVVVKSVKIA